MAKHYNPFAQPNITTQPFTQHEADQLRGYLDMNPCPLQNGDVRFGESLLGYWKRNGELTPKQIPYAYKLLEKAEESTTGSMKPKRPDHIHQNIGSMQGVNALFAKARENHIPTPSIKIMVDGKKLKLSQKAADGPINITEWVGDEGKSKWYGAVLPSGDLSLSTKFPAPAGLTQLLMEFSVNPSAASGANGKRMRACCFCSRTLESGDSLFYGYGPICAEKWGLEWGEAKARKFESDLDVALEELKGVI